MNMRREFSLILLLCMAHLLWAIDLDKENTLGFDIQGTARYVAMAGAMTAVGGDASAVRDNPAGLGIFRHNELSVTLDYQLQPSKSGFGTVNDRLTTQFGLPQLSWVICFGDNDRLKGLVFNNLMLSYHRVAQYKRNLNPSGTFAISQTDLMAELTNGLTKNDFDRSLDDVWDDINIGWLSVLGYRAGLIEPVDSASTDWHSILSPNEQVSANLNIQESGTSDEYSIAYAANISNRIYLGINMNISTLLYSKTTTYTEQFDYGGGYALQSEIRMNGIGWSTNIGVIYRPVNMLRIGASWQSPTLMAVNYSNNGSIESNVDTTGISRQISTPYYSYSSDKYQLPMRSTFGLAYQFSTKGLLSVEYDYLHHFRHETADRHFLKIGGEYVCQNWFFRLGYAFQSAFMKYETEPLFRPIETDTRTDTDFRNVFYAHYASAGVGFRNRKIVAELAYQYRLQHIRQYAHYNQFDTPFELYPQTHRIVLTLAFGRSRF